MLSGKQQILWCLIPFLCDIHLPWSLQLWFSHPLCVWHPAVWTCLPLLILLLMGMQTVSRVGLSVIVVLWTFQKVCICEHKYTPVLGLCPEGRLQSPRQGWVVSWRVVSTYSTARPGEVSRTSIPSATVDMTTFTVDVLVNVWNCHMGVSSCTSLNTEKEHIFIWILATDIRGECVFTSFARFFCLFFITTFFVGNAHCRKPFPLHFTVSFS